jgi:lysophospholipase L1-like esterase
MFPGGCHTIASMKPIALAILFSALALSQAASPAPGPVPSPVSDARDVMKLRTSLERAQTTLQDWPNLQRYREDNAKLAAPQAGEERVVFMGDSITDAWGRQYGQFFPGKPYVNRGISGQTTPQMLIRFRPDVIALKPKAVVILAGTNDLSGNTGPMTLDETEGNLMSMAELAKANGIQVVLSAVMPVCDYIRPQTARRPPEKIVALNKWIKDYAASNGFVYLDYYTPMIDDAAMLKKELTYDGLHPNEAGYAIMMPAAQKAIDVALGAR